MPKPPALSAAERQGVVTELYALLVRTQLYVREPTVGRTLNNFIASLIRRWRVYPAQ